MTEEEIENYFVESAGYGRDKVRNFMDIVNKALKQKGERIADLEKENAELKERLKEHESIGNAQFWENVWSWKSKAEQLTKAKELLKQLVDIEYAINIPKEKIISLRVKAEKFLSEVEK